LIFYGRLWLLGGGLEKKLFDCDFKLIEQKRKWDNLSYRPCKARSILSSALTIHSNPSPLRSFSKSFFLLTTNSQPPYLSKISNAISANTYKQLEKKQK